MMDSRSVCILILLIIAAMIVLSICTIMRRMRAEYEISELDKPRNEQTEQVRVKIIAKSSEGVKRAVFEYEDGRRMALIVDNAADFDGMAVGAVGVLTYSGTKFIRFDSGI